MARATILFPGSYWAKTEVDDELKPEGDAALATGELDVAVFDYEGFHEGGELKLTSRTPDPRLPIIYRGWMMLPDEYARFNDALSTMGFLPFVSPSAYESLHLFPNSYKAVSADSPGLLAYEGTEVNAEEVNASFGRFMMKDWVKSVKGTSFPSCIETPISQDELDGLISEFVRLRGSLFTKGIVIKEYVDLMRRGGKTNEWRAFYLDGKQLTLNRNSDQAASAPRPPKRMVARHANLPSPFYTVDYAELEDGSWTILETGDGQVSGIACSQGPDVFYRLLAEGPSKTLETMRQKA